MSGSRFFLLLCPLLLLTHIAVCQDETIATWEPIADETLFPAIILSTSSLQVAKSKVIGDPHGLIGVVVTPSIANARVHVNVRVDGLSEESVLDATLGEPKQQYTVVPTVRFDTQKLLKLEQPLPTTILFSVNVNGVDLGQRTKHIEVRAINDVPFLVSDSQGHTQDVSVLFAAFVNENSPIIDEVLREALQWKSVQRFAGYQGTARDVQMQVFAIWNVLQRKHVRYSSITTPSGYSGTVRSQTVRFVDDTWRMNQANCVDGSVLFASVLYKIGIFPVLVKLPGHMFVGYYMDANSYGTLKNVQYLETTLLGAGRQPTLTQDVAFNPLWHPIQSSESYRQFANAVTYGDQEFQKEVIPALQQHVPGFMLIDIRRAREKGVSPISH